MRSDPRVEVGAYVFWDRTVHPEEVWEVVEHRRPMNYKIHYVAGPPLRNPCWTHKIALWGSLTKISPLEVLALMARGSEEWEHPNFGEM